MLRSGIQDEQASDKKRKEKDRKGEKRKERVRKGEK